MTLTMAPLEPPSPPPSTMNSDQQVNLLELAAASLASTILASRPIRSLATTSRVKTDGSPVTDADGAAQRIICDLLRKVSSKIRIVGEETLQEVESGSKSIDQRFWQGVNPRKRRKGIQEKAKEEEVLFQNIFNELCERRKKVTETMERVSLPEKLLFVEEEVTAHRISVFIDPLDGTSAYMKGNYTCVTTLVGIIVDNCPVFGVIGQPFGGEGIIESEYECAAVYGGTLIGGAFSVGGMELKRSIMWKNVKVPICAKKLDGTVNDDDDVENIDYMKRKAIISKSRAGGVVQKCINALASRGLLHRELIHITGAGYKTMCLLLGTHGESLWFFPKPGTSLWDIAAADALLRVMGGKLSDKFGRDMDYSKEWMDAENMDGIVACSDSALHAECIKLYREEGWDDDTK
mmetsp:Transcript_10806/g.12772  ORF Transcript_10806/g.12772 Transcript_10806/m.12772 type:complete len:406 (+) Transcript_10806:173-1390(+)